MLRTGLRQVAGSASYSFSLGARHLLIRLAVEAAVRVLAAGISLTVGWGAEAPSLNPLGT
jgi:hypothetical protein